MDMFPCCRRTVNSSATATQHVGSADPPELLLVEFCQLVDFLLDIVSLVSLAFFLSFFLSFFLAILHSLSFFPSLISKHFHAFFLSLVLFSVLLCHLQIYLFHLLLVI